MAQWPENIRCLPLDKTYHSPHLVSIKGGSKSHVKVLHLVSLQFLVVLSTMSAPARGVYTFENEDSLPPGVARLLRVLLQNWDKTDDETHAYLDAFTPNGTLDLPPNCVTGHDAIRGMRNSIIHPTNGPVTKVDHWFGRLYILPEFQTADSSKGPKKMDTCMTGAVEYTVRGGKVVRQEFSTRFDLVAVGDDEWKVQYAKIYQDNTPLMAAIGNTPAA
jgi:hypothetical protein